MSVEEKKMKKAKKTNYTPWYIAGGVVLVLLILVGWFAGSYNSLVRYDEGVTEAWGNVEVQYQRRADLIPNLVETVKGFTDQEQKILLGVTEARSAWTTAKNSGSIDKQITAANNMDGALSRLLVTVEAYPDLKSNQNFLSLQDELAGTENRVSVARTRYNEIVRVYNTKVRSFPTNIIAGMFSFEKATTFEADEGSDAAPQVNF